MLRPLVELSIREFLLSVGKQQKEGSVSDKGPPMIVQNLNYRLPMLSTVPTPSELSFMLALAANNPRNILELPWKTSASPAHFMVTVTCVLSLEEPRWILYSGTDELQHSIVWNYDTADTNLIYDMITAEHSLSAQSWMEQQSVKHFVPAPAAGNGNEVAEQSPSSAPPAISAGSVETTVQSQSQNQTATGADGSLSAGGGKVLPTAVEFDRNAVDTMYKAFTNPETGFISHSAFLFFLVGEFSRFQRHQHALSLVRFDMRVKFDADGMHQPLSLQAARIAGQRIFRHMRTLDWAAHYENEFALLLPYTSRDEAAQIAERIQAALFATPLAPEITAQNLKLCFGIASMPEDCIHPGVLLAAAQEAKNQSKLSGKSVVLFGAD